MATPQVPPRPTRSTQAPTTDSEVNPPIPQIPPRPAGRRHELSEPPDRDRYAQSPLNAPFIPKPAGAPNDPYNGNAARASGSNLDLPYRPPSVNLPSIGQEGNEYESYSEYEAEPLSRTVSAMSAAQTSHVGTDLPLHAPKPGLSQSEARARVQGVTNTDNNTPSSPGGRRLSAQFDDKDSQYRSLRSRSSAHFRPPSAASTERPGSAQPEDHGIPQIGVHVPMYRQAGDVQAPSPAQLQSPYAQDLTGKPRHHNRTRSGRDQSNPPDSYGRHGHGVIATDKFEKDWYAKHPEAFAQEGHYSHLLNGPRREYVLSSEELNKLVRESGSGAGFGTAPNIAGLPDEQIGYIASEEYAWRMSSRPGSSYSNLASPGVTQTKFDTALRKSTSRDSGVADKGYEMSRTTTNDSEIIHVDAPEHHWSKVTGEGTSTPPVDLGPHGGNTSEQGGFIDEQGYGIPILASDELRPESAWQRPAISPSPYDRQGSTDLRNHFGSHPGSAGHSRPGSRPGSIHGMANLSRFVSTEDLEVHTPLDDVDEYEPLFDDDDEEVQKPVTEATRFKRRPEMKHRFPSQDIWEDSPDSARLETEVNEPEQGDEATSPMATKPTAFESPEAESARKGEATEADRVELLSKEERLATSEFKPQIRRDLRRPGNQRFPSHDIWEDSPDSARLETTIGDSEEDEENPAEVAGAVVQTSADRGDLGGSTARDGATVGAPIVPARPTKPSKHISSVPKEHSHLSEVYTASAETSQLPVAEIQRSAMESRKAPVIPERPKPQIPARPNRADATSPPDEAASPKVKPPVPARPMGSKIAALQAGFMSDLNNRLKLGPQAPPKPSESDRSEDEPEEDKQPLSDARKGRARGPARRKPGPAPAVEAPTGRKMPKLSFAKPITVWHISPKGALDVVYETPEPPSEDPIKHQATTITEKALDLTDDDHVSATPVPTKSAENPTIPAHAMPGDQSLGQSLSSATIHGESREHEYAVNPLPASSGPGNPISLPAGEPIPPHAQSLSDNITLDRKSYENAGAGSDPPSSFPKDTGIQATEKHEAPAQTGMKSIAINPDTPGSQKLTVIEGGHALTGEDVVIQADTPKDDEGHLRSDLA